MPLADPLSLGIAPLPAIHHPSSLLRLPFPEQQGKAGSSRSSRKPTRRGASGAERQQAWQNDMGAPKVLGNFVAILISPSLYLRETEVKEAKRIAPDHMARQRWVGQRWLSLNVSSMINIQARLISRALSVPACNSTKTCLWSE